MVSSFSINCFFFNSIARLVMAFLDFFVLFSRLLVKLFSRFPLFFICCDLFICWGGLLVVACWFPCWGIRFDDDAFNGTHIRQSGLLQFFQWEIICLELAQWLFLQLAPERRSGGREQSIFSIGLGSFTKIVQNTYPLGSEPCEEERFSLSNSAAFHIALEV